MKAHCHAVRRVTVGLPALYSCTQPRHEVQSPMTRIESPTRHEQHTQQHTCIQHDCEHTEYTSKARPPRNLQTRVRAPPPPLTRPFTRARRPASARLPHRATAAVAAAAALSAAPPRPLLPPSTLPLSLSPPSPSPPPLPPSPLSPSPCRCCRHRRHCCRRRRRRRCRCRRLLLPTMKSRERGALAVESCARRRQGLGARQAS